MVFVLSTNVPANSWHRNLRCSLSTGSNQKRQDLVPLQHWSEQSRTTTRRFVAFGINQEIVPSRGNRLEHAVETLQFGPNLVRRKLLAIASFLGRVQMSTGSNQVAGRQQKTSRPQRQQPTPEFQLVRVNGDASFKSFGGPVKDVLEKSRRNNRLVDCSIALHEFFVEFKELKDLPNGMDRCFHLVLWSSNHLRRFDSENLCDSSKRHRGMNVRHPI